MVLLAQRGHALNHGVKYAVDGHVGRGWWFGGGVKGVGSDIGVVCEGGKVGKAVGTRHNGCGQSYGCTTMGGPKPRKGTVPSALRLIFISLD